MSGYRYETHVLPNPQLPFIYHPYFRVERTHKVPNWHENLELIQCLTGAGSVRCGPDIYALAPGEVLLVGSNIPHSIGSNGEMTYRCLIIDNSFFLENGVPVDTLQFAPQPRDPAVTQALAQASEVFENRRPEDFAWVLEARWAVLGLVRALCKGALLPARRPAAETGSVRLALEYLRRNLSSPIALEAVATHAGVSKFHLARQFKRYTGRTVVEMYNYMRCTEARRLIEGGTPVARAAAAWGFESPSYFSRTFKAFFGIAPSQVAPREGKTGANP